MTRKNRPPRRRKNSRSSWGWRKRRERRAGRGAAGRAGRRRPVGGRGAVGCGPPCFCRWAWTSAGTNKNDLAVKFCAGPLRFPVYPRPQKKAAKAKAKPKAKTKPEQKAASPEPGPPPAPPAQNKDEAAGASAPQPDAAQQGPAPAPAAQPDAGGLLGAARTLAAALWPRRQAFLNRIRVRHLNIFWTVTGADRRRHRHYIRVAASPPAIWRWPQRATISASRPTGCGWNPILPESKKKSAVYLAKSFAERI